MKPPVHCSLQCARYAFPHVNEVVGISWRKEHLSPVLPQSKYFDNSGGFYPAFSPFARVPRFLFQVHLLLSLAS